MKADYTKEIKETRYQIEIKYPNRPDEWCPFYESYATMTVATFRLLEIRSRWTMNEFRVVPV